jgi:hypothetical protein
MAPLVRLAVVLIVSSLLSPFPALSYDKQHEEGFFYPKDLENYPIYIEDTYDAVAPFPMRFSNCSGSYISPDGYFLTALHCVLDALDLTEQYRFPLADAAEVVKVPQEAIIGSKYTYGTFRSTVVAAGAGYGQLDERIAHTYEPWVFDEIQKYIGTDWAILKVDNQPPHFCLEVADSRPEEAEYSWTIGFPARTYRRAGTSTNNRRKLVSYGRIAFTANESGFYKILPPANRKLAVDFWNELIDKGEYFVTDADIQGGNSGSPVINEWSELIGLLVQGLISDQRIGAADFFTYTSGAIDVQWIRESLGQEKFHTYFSCMYR